MMRHPNIFRLHEESESKDDEIDDHNDDENDLEQEADAEKEVVYGKPPEVLPPKDTDRVSPNIEMDVHTFFVNSERVIDYLNSLERPSKTAFLLAYECPQEIGYYRILVRSDLLYLKPCSSTFSLHWWHLQELLWFIFTDCFNGTHPLASHSY
ncbi:uncharacterized protein LOC111921374 isoform X2 [Lactuca sativa]|nr:uncharacterized protein LOC111921374 isoform X2 [Lactuca sativa]XP_023772700.1 uncharacterized protein LOC111921374 isoform X2 [Lactuca sativa]